MTPFVREAPEEHDDIDGVASPAETREVQGHPAAREAFQTALRSGRLHHAWLLQGPRGIGKATAAFEFARLLLSGTDTEEGTPLASESLFRQIAQGGHPNLLHIARPPGERGGFRTQITVDGIRRLNHFFHTTAGGRWRVAIIDPADDMNRNAANALLKILEEPPERSIFLIVNHQPGRLLSTIRSRCRVLRFDPLDFATIETVIGKATGESDGATLRSAAERADGSVRTALLMLLAGGIDIAAETGRLYQAEPDWAALQKLADTLGAKGREAAWDLMAADLFRLLAEEAEHRLHRGDRAMAAELAAYWQSETARWREAAAFNLDRKQVLLTFFAGLAERRARAAAAA